MQCVVTFLREMVVAKVVASSIPQDTEDGMSGSHSVSQNQVDRASMVISRRGRIAFSFPLNHTEIHCCVVAECD